MNSMPFVSVIVPCRNEAAFIEKAVCSILSNDYPEDRYEVLVIDGRSTDETRDIVNRIAAKDQRVRLIDNPGKIQAVAMNIGFEAMQGDLFIRIDGHAEVPSDFISQSVKCLHEHPEAWVVGGCIDTVAHTYVGQAISAAMRSPVGVGNAHFRLGGYEGYVDTLAFGTHHKWISDKIGYFDEQLARNEDDDFNMRIILGGGKIWMSKSIRSTYYSRGSLSKLWRQYFQYGFGKIRTIQKHKRLATFRQVVPLLLVASLLGLFLAGLAFRPLWWLLAIEVLLYIGVLTLGTLDVGRKSGIKYTPIAPLIFIILHFAYGLGGLWGIIRYILLAGRGIVKPEDISVTR